MSLVTGTFAGIIPVTKIEDRTLNSNHKNSLTLKIKELYDNHIISYIKKNNS